MVSYEKEILVYGTTGIRKIDLPPEDFENLALIISNITDYGYSESMCTLANFYEHGCKELGIAVDEDKATYWYGRAARENNVEAMFCYGNRLVANSNSGEDVELQNLGLSYMMKAADGGFPRAQFMVGLAYKLGISGEINYEKALFYLRKASLAGEKEADEIIQEICGI